LYQYFSLYTKSLIIFQNKDLLDLLSKVTLGTEHERTLCRTPDLNAHIESFHKSFHRILEDECFGCQEFQNMAPNEFYKNHLLKNVTTKEVKA